jgi:hypothetical protein
MVGGPVAVLRRRWMEGDAGSGQLRLVLGSREPPTDGSNMDELIDLVALRRSAGGYLDQVAAGRNRKGGLCRARALDPEV